MLVDAMWTSATTHSGEARQLVLEPAVPTRHLGIPLAWLVLVGLLGIPRIARSARNVVHGHGGTVVLVTVYNIHENTPATVSTPQADGAEQGTTHVYEVPSTVSDQHRDQSWGYLHRGQPVRLKEACCDTNVFTYLAYNLSQGFTRMPSKRTLGAALLGLTLHMEPVTWAWMDAAMRS